MNIKLIWNPFRIDFIFIILYINSYIVHNNGRYKMTDHVKPSLPHPVRRALRKLGADVRAARLRRRISTQMLAERAAISRTTLNKVEKGDPSVAMWVYASILFVLGLTDRLEKLADHTEDKSGLQLEEAQLPQRIRARKKTKQTWPTQDKDPTDSSNSSSA